VVSTEGMIARELRNAADRYIDLNELRPYIEKVDPHPLRSEFPPSAVRC